MTTWMMKKKAEQDSSRLVATLDYDTFGLTAADLARKEVTQDLKKRPSVIPGPLLEDVIVPVSRSIGFELLRKMGWRHGRSIGPKHIVASSDVQKEGRKAMMALASSEQDELVIEENVSDVLHPVNDAEFISRSTPVYVISPKKDRHGFGFDPYRNAPEFRERWKSEEALGRTKAMKDNQFGAFKSSLFRPNVGRMGGGFGIGALEDLGEEDEDVYAPGLEVENIISDEEADTLSHKLVSQPKKTESRPGVLPGFRPASQPGYKIELFPPPAIPPGFDVKHHFRETLESEMVIFSYEPPEVTPPDDSQLRKLIDGLATFVARSGQKLESLYKEKQSENPLFKFLSEGRGHDYYKRKVWEEQTKNKRDGMPENIRDKALNSAHRGQILGETPLHRQSMLPPEDRARLQAALSSAFTSSIPKAEESLLTSKPFSKDLSKQARFELFLKEKYQGGLRNVHATGKSSLTEWERAQETLEFEAACQNLPKSETNSTASASPIGTYQRDLQAIINERFTVQSADKVPAVQSSNEDALKYPIREEKPWRPHPLVCKRFNLPDPYSGKPPPLPKPRSRTESFILLSSPSQGVSDPAILLEKSEQLLISSVASVTSNHPREQDSSAPSIEIVENENAVSNIVEKPVDLYKAIFSDESDEEDEANTQGIETASIEAAKTALTRLEAGDFLASIGKELGLQVPPSEMSQMKRSQDITNETQAFDVKARVPQPGTADRPLDQKSNLLRKAMDTPKRGVENSETSGVFSDIRRLELSGEHFHVVSSLNSRESLSKRSHEDSRTEKLSNRDQSLTQITSESSDETSHEDSSDSEKRRHQRRRKREQKGQREREHRSEKRKRGHEHKRKKRHEESKHQSHKHHRHRK
ncbi:hypothetical protein KP509_03G041500 [Ceratopteris richardii]|nr:hypothetical protein KP509_03G041500 [Ceratopteris richardii]